MKPSASLNVAGDPNETSSMFTSLLVTTVTVVLTAALVSCVRQQQEQSRSMRQQQKQDDIERARNRLVGRNPKMVSVNDYDNNNEPSAQDGVKDDQTKSSASSSSPSSGVKFLTTITPCTSSETDYDSRTDKDGHNQTATTDTTTTAVFIHGFGCMSLEFRSVIEELTLLCSTKRMGIDTIFNYDRVLFVDDPRQELVSGGQEKDGRQGSRDASTLANELHQMLESRCMGQKHKQTATATATTPCHKYILIGHSYGGLIAQYFTWKYPHLVDGLVLIDPAHELQNQKLPKDFVFGMTTIIPYMMKLYEVVTTYCPILFHWMDKLDMFNFPPLFLISPKSNELRHLALREYSTNPYVWKLVDAELQGCYRTFGAINNNASHHTSDGIFNRKRFYPQAITKAFMNMHTDMPCRLFMADQSDHWIHMQQPDIVVQAIEYVLENRQKTNA